jgi:uncharacterized protein DUF1194
MLNIRRLAWCGVLALLLCGASPARAEAVDLELVFAADGSGSIDDDELRLQRRGWADALTSAGVLAAIRGGAIGAVAVAFMEWGGPRSQVLIVDWHVVRDAESARAFADRLLSAPRGAFGYNSISNAIDFSVRLVEGNRHEGTRKVIDVSGDGPNIGGRPLAAAREGAVAKGFTINALAIRRPGGRPGGPGGEPLEDFYAQEVIGGPGAFVEVADETRPFALAAQRKLLTEVADRPAPGRRYAVQSSRVWTCLRLVESGLASGLPFELGGAEEAQRRVAPERIVEAVDVAGQGVARLGPGPEHGAPDQLALQRLEERLDHGVDAPMSVKRPRVGTRRGALVRRGGQRSRAPRTA